MDTIARKLAGIAEKLAAARRSINPPLAPAELKELELQFGLYLPDDYRAFLVQLGDGGAAGPYQGILSLREALRSQPAPLEEFPVTYDEAAAGLDCTFEEMRAGSLLLCEIGSERQARLVLLGEARGRVVYVDLHRSAPPYFVRDATFLDWYERWLDELLNEEYGGRFGLDNPDMDPDKREVAVAVAPEIPPGHPFREQLEKIRAVLWKHTGGNPASHSCYRPPLSAQECEALELRHQVTLPAHYRAFLEFVQASGEGPYYGLTPIEFVFPTLAEGTVKVAHLGLAEYACLSLTGEAVGQVFYINNDSPRFNPYFPPDENFLDWYEREFLKRGPCPPWKKAV